MNVRLTQLDGKLPNLALMKLASWHRARGDAVYFYRSPYRQLDEPAYGRVYGSAIFAFSNDRVAAFRMQFPEAVIGGTGTPEKQTVEDIIGEQWERYDYADYPDYRWSIGFTQRGCRLKCKFCVVPGKEGKPASINAIADIWRGEGHPKCLHLLDNDFFGQPKWRERIQEIRDGGFKVCLNQGINVRLINDEAAEALASVEYRDDGFSARRIYTAWDNLKDEAVFFRGMDTLERAGIPPTHVMAYMLIGFAKDETWERVLYRFNKMVARGIRPFPMIYGDRSRGLPLGGYNGRIDHKPLWEFQKWAVRRYYELMPFEAFDNNARQRRDAAEELAL